MRILSAILYDATHDFPLISASSHSYPNTPCVQSMSFSTNIHGLEAPLPSSSKVMS